MSMYGINNLFDKSYLKKVTKGEKSKEAHYDAAEEDEKKKQEQHRKRKALQELRKDDDDKGNNIDLLL